MKPRRAFKTKFGGEVQRKLSHPPSLQADVNSVRVNVAQLQVADVYLFGEHRAMNCILSFVEVSLSIDVIV